MEKLHVIEKRYHSPFGEYDTCVNCGKITQDLGGKEAPKFCQPTPWWILRGECMKALGWGLIYCQYAHNDPGYEEQFRKEIIPLCEEFKLNNDCRSGDQKYWVDLLRRCTNATENLC